MSLPLAVQREFGKYGQIYSIKIMWPRSEEERARRRNCGFVSFFTRKDADSARVSLHDKEVGSCCDFLMPIRV